MIEKYKKHLISFYKKHLRMPSYSELASLLSFKSKSSAHELVRKLIEENFLNKDSTGKLIPGQSFFSLKLLGTVEAGFPTPAEEELADTMTLDEYLIDNKDATYILRVNGDSMKNAGIVSGDMVIADRSATAREGDIVIAEVDNRWTMKYLRKNNGKTYLEAANEKYPNIYPNQELKIAAVVKGVIRKY